MTLTLACRPAVTALALLSIAASESPAQAFRAALSTRATTEVVLNPVEAQGAGGAKPLTIRLDYGQPHLRGRTVHTDSLVPYDQPWRTGANAATRLSTEVDLVLGGVTIPKGTYVLFTLPSRSGWKLLIVKNGPEQEMSYNAANEVARVDLRMRTLAEPTESLSMTLVPAPGAGPAHGELRISWATFALFAEWSVKVAP